MGLFGNLFGANVTAAVQKFSGDKDFLEAGCAVGALVGAADGNIDDAEYDAALAVMNANKILGAAFSPSEIESVFGKMAPKTKTRSGKAELINEIREGVAKDRDGTKAKALMLIGIDVADQGDIGADEEKVLRTLSEVLKVNYEKALAGTL